MRFIFLVAIEERLTFIASAHFIALQGPQLQFRNTRMRQSTGMSNGMLECHTYRDDLPGGGSAKD
jgi:hypothetical protein